MFSVFFISAHGVHLAVMDVMYKKAPGPGVPSEQEEEDTNIESQLEMEVNSGGSIMGEETESENNNSEWEEEEEDEEAQMTENFLLEEFPADDVLPDLSYRYQDVINDLRHIVKSFRHK